MATLFLITTGLASALYVYVLYQVRRERMRPKRERAKTQARILQMRVAVSRGKDVRRMSA